MNLKSEKTWPFLAGFLLTVNLYVVPFLATSPRATDLAGVALFPWIILRLAQGKQRPLALAAVGVLALSPVIWLFFNILSGDIRSAVLTTRWLLALPWAAALFLLLENEKFREYFAWGLVIGGLANVGVMILQLLGFESLLQAVGLSSSGANYSTAVAHQVRIPGLHGQHNASSSVLSLLVPAGFYLYFRGRMSLVMFLGSLLALLVALNLTSTRSPLLVSLVTVGFALATARRLKLSIILATVAMTFLVPLLVVYGPPGGWARWKNTEALISNATERQDSGRGALQLSLENPLGLGAAQGSIKLIDKTGIRATHNAFLQASLVWGLPFGLLILGGLVSTVMGGIKGVESPLYLASLLGIHLAGLFMFEEHLNNPTFIIMAAWLVSLGLVRGAFDSRVRVSGSPAGEMPDNPTRSPE